MFVVCRSNRKRDPGEVRLFAVSTGVRLDGCPHLQRLEDQAGTRSSLGAAEGEQVFWGTQTHFPTFYSTFVLCTNGCDGVIPLWDDAWSKSAEKAALKRADREDGAPRWKKQHY